MKVLALTLLLQLILCAVESKYEELSKKIIKELNYIYLERAYEGGSTFVKGRKFRYTFKSISEYEIEIARSIDGICLDEPFILDLRHEYYAELEPDTKCDPALKISHELDIVYLYVKDRCGHFGGFNLYKRAKEAAVRLKGHLHEVYRLDK